MPDNRANVIVIIVTVVMAIALLGQYQLNPQAFLERPSDAVYRALQLFAAEGDWTHGTDVLLLQIARFMAPVATVTTLLLIFAEGIWVFLVNSQVVWYRNHIVVVGLSESALMLIEDCRRHGLPVVVITPDRDSRYVAACKAQRVPVLVGDPLAGKLLQSARSHNAKALISFLGSDDENIELSLRLQEFVKDRRGSTAPLRVVLQVHDMQLAQRLAHYPKFFEVPEALEVHFLTLDEQAARALFSDYTPEVFADALMAPTVHIVVFGFNELGRQVLMTALRRAHYGASEPLIVTVLCPDAQAANDLFQRQCPSMSIAANVRFEAVSLVPELVAERVPALLIDSATMLVCCLDGDSENLSMALALRQMTLTRALPNAPIMVSLRSAQGLAQLVEARAGAPEIPDGLLPFGTIDQLMKVARIFDDQMDRLAIGLHNDYVKSLAPGTAPQPSHRPWGQLPEVFRDYNRSQADHIATKLRRIGCTLTAGGAAAEPFQFHDDELVLLAQMEKRRWNAERASLGWVHAEHRSDLAKAHPLLKPWEQCSLEERAYDIRAIRELPRLLHEELGFGIARTIVIGITGHRAHRIEKHLPAVTRGVQAELEAIAQCYPGAQFVVLSALADGSDRLVADLAMRMLGARLHAALPLPYEIYRKSFGDTFDGGDESLNQDFQAFVGRAEVYFELPLKAGVDVLERADAEGVQARARQYALAGAYIASRCHELIAVWDGQTARGLGGTGDIVAWRENGGVPPEYRFPSRFHQPVEAGPARVVRLPDEG